MEFYWQNVFSMWGLLSALGGAVFGILWGCLPGLSATMAMALLIGLTYNMPTELAVIFMIASYTGVEFGGAISAILINIPGTPAAIPTQLAGHPLTKSGLGGQAIGAAALFSFLGNWIGIVILIGLAPMMIEFALRFGSWEMFLLAMLGIAVSGTLTAKERPAKGWAMGCAGLLVSMIGIEGQYGIERFTFGLNQLNAGIHFVPVIIGLFGLSEAFAMAANPVGKTIPAQIGRVVPPFDSIRKYWRSGLRSGMIGTLIGVIPGAGANVASFVSYSVGEQVTRKNFSKGDMEGVVCSEVANNANIGGGLLPTLTLGIPGNNSCALFLAALGLHGVIVGPTIEIDQPGFMQFLFVALLVANLFMFATAFTIIRPSIRVCSLPSNILMPLIVILCFIGTYVANYSGFDVAILFVCGVLGFILKKHSYPLAPFVLGLILGPIADENVRRVLLLYEGQYSTLLLRPIGDALILAVIWAFWFGLKRSRRQSVDESCR
ncbi:MAG: tripartite tricarboxylate transporter permease [Pseudomonadota bacterium]